MAIRNVLKEELANSERMKKRYEEELARLPKGSLVRRVIKGQEYYYLVYRQDGKFRSEYKGKSSPDQIAEFAAIKKKRAEYRKLLSKVKRQIRFLRSAIRGSEAI